MKNRIEDDGCGLKGAGGDEHRAIEAHRVLNLQSESGLLDPESRILNPSKGFTLIELLIVIGIVAILAGMFFSRVLVYQELAEKAAMQQVVSAVQSGLILEYGHRMASGMGPLANNITHENPIDWLARKPTNYAGEFNKVYPAAIEPGNWAFDKETHELVYFPNHVEYFVPAKQGVRWIRYHTRFVYESSFRAKEIKVLTGVTFSPVEPFQWSIKEKE